VAQVISFRECFRRRILKPMDDIVASLMKSLQPAGELCLRAVVDDVRHRLPLSALTHVGLSHAPTMEAGTAGTDTQASLHRSSVTPVVSTDHMGRRDLSLAGGWLAEQT